MVQGKLCHRMNGRGVDINRNYDNHFGVHAPEYLPAEEYEGTAAASEPVSRTTIAARVWVALSDNHHCK